RSRNSPAMLRNRLTMASEAKKACSSSGLLKRSVRRPRFLRIRAAASVSVVTRRCCWSWSCWRRASMLSLAFSRCSRMAAKTATQLFGNSVIVTGALLYRALLLGLELLAPCLDAFLGVRTLLQTGRQVLVVLTKLSFQLLQLVQHPGHQTIAFPHIRQRADAL